jgi:hypothetical protein
MSTVPRVGANVMPRMFHSISCSLVQTKAPSENLSGTAVPNDYLETDQERLGWSETQVGPIPLRAKRLSDVASMKPHACTKSIVIPVSPFQAYFRLTGRPDRSAAVNTVLTPPTRASAAKELT